MFWWFLHDCRKPQYRSHHFVARELALNINQTSKHVITHLSGTTVNQGTCKESVECLINFLYFHYYQVTELSPPVINSCNLNQFCNNINTCAL